MSEFITCIVCKTCNLAQNNMEKGEKGGSSVIYLAKQLRICKLRYITISIAKPHAGNAG